VRLKELVESNIYIYIYDIVVLPDKVNGLSANRATRVRNVGHQQLPYKITLDKL
jgi:hypothetical protein